MSAFVLSAQKAIEEAIQHLQQHRVVALPTETVYGLAGLATSDTAVAAIYATKKRPLFNPLIVHVENLAQAQEVGVFSAQALALAHHFWPGPLTLVVPLRPDARLSSLALCGLSTVALRVPNHPVMQAVLRGTGPLVAPSANPSGQISATTALHVRRLFQDKVPVVDGGACTVGVESTIVACLEDHTPPRLLRWGGVALEQLQDVLGEGIALGQAQDTDDIIAPGMLLRHYAPRKPLFLNQEKPHPHQSFLTFGRYGQKDCAQEEGLDPTVRWWHLSPRADTTEAAAHLFAMLHAADQDPLTHSIAVMPIPCTGLGRAINDRLTRGAQGEG